MFSRIKSWFNSESLWSKNLGLSVMRVGIGLIFLKFGTEKLLAGPSKWHELGTATKYLGITFLPTVWGLLAACAEFFGGMALVIGLATRLAAFLIACVMFVAVTMHYSINDSWTHISFPLAIFFVMAGLIIAGGGSYSVDKYLHRKQQ